MDLKGLASVTDTLQDLTVTRVCLAPSFCSSFLIPRFSALVFQMFILTPTSLEDFRARRRSPNSTSHVLDSNEHWTD